MIFHLRFSANLLKEAEYDSLKTLLLETPDPDFRPKSLSEFLYGELWLEDDLERLITLYYHNQDPDTSKLLSTISQLRQLVEADAKSIWACGIHYPQVWLWEDSHGPEQLYAECRVELSVETCVILTALRFGLYEVWPTYTLADNFRSINLQFVTEALKGPWSVMTIHSPPFGPHFNRLLQTLATCLADGTSANSAMLVGERLGNVSVWQNLVWDTIMKFGTRRPASFAPAWLLFILFGADRDFTISFEKSCNFSSKDRRGRLVILTGKWGVSKSQVHSPTYLNGDEYGDNGEGGCGGQDSDSSKILDLARRHDWSVPLKELTYFFFPSYADSFRRIYDLYESNVDITLERLLALRRELGLDPECWQTQEWSNVLPRLQFNWEGVSHLLKDSEYESYDSSLYTINDGFLN